MLPPHGLQRGVVVAFDDAAGYGTLRTDDGAEWWFHCTAIADGTRRIVVGDAGVFAVTAGLSGRWEAVGITKLSSGGATATGEERDR